MCFNLICPNRPSSENYSQFFEDIKFTQTIHSKSYPPLPDSGDFSCEPPTHFWGYFSPKCAEYFIWEYRVFKEGTTVIFCDDLRLVRITKVVGVGHNFIKFGVETLGSSSEDEVPVWRIIVSFSPDSFHLTHSQCLKRYFFCWFLTSMRDIVDVERVWDESEVMAQDDLNVDYGKLLGEMFGFMMWEWFGQVLSLLSFMLSSAIISAFILLSFCPGIFHRKFVKFVTSYWS